MTKSEFSTMLMECLKDHLVVDVQTEETPSYYGSDPDHWTVKVSLAWRDNPLDTLGYSDKVFSQHESDIVIRK